jgi:hypothetical protein
MRSRFSFALSVGVIAASSSLFACSSSASPSTADGGASDLDGSNHEAGTNDKGDASVGDNHPPPCPPAWDPTLCGTSCAPPGINCYYADKGALVCRSGNEDAGAEWVCGL